MFDQLVKIYEANEEVLGQTNLGRLLNDARIFGFKESVHELDIDYREEVNDNFFLPFSTVAIQDPESLEILSAKDDQALGLRREFECWSFRTGEPFHFLVWGKVDWVRLDTATMKMCCAYGVYMMAAFSGTEMVHAVFDDEIPQAVRQQQSQNPITAFEEAMYISQPKVFVVESEPTYCKVPLIPRIKRRNERPVYTALRPEEIRRVMCLPTPQGNHKSPVPHERRRHRRILRHDRYGENIGREIVIPATWVGPRESIVGNKRYRVLTEI